MLELKGLSKHFGGVRACDELDVTVDEGEILGLIGPNGSGKSTAVNLICGVYDPTHGSVVFHGEDIATLTPHRRLTAGIARTFQNIRLFAGMTVLENLVVAQHNSLMRASGFTLLGLFVVASYVAAERAAVEFAAHWLDKINLTDKADWEAGNLAYGDQRRLEIARAMCSKPVLLCLDEPAAGLNPRESADLNELLIYIRDEHKIGVLLIEHDMSVVMGISDHIAVLDYGRKISEGTPEFVRNDPAVIRAYLGEDEDA